MNIQELKDRAKRSAPDLPTAQVIDGLCALYRGRGTVYTTAGVAEKTRLDIRAVASTLLVLSDPLRVVQPQWLYIDDDDVLHYLTPIEVSEALEHREFFHPESGARIYDFEDTISLVYEPDETLVQLLSPDRLPAAG